MIWMDKLLYGEKYIENNEIFHADNEELTNLKKYFQNQKEKGITDYTIVDELLSLGWTRDELNFIVPNELKKYNRSNQKNTFKIYTIGFLIMIIILLGSIFGYLFNSDIIVLAIIIPVLFLIFKIISLISIKNMKISIIERRIILFFNRMKKIFGLKKFPDANDYLNKVKIRNKKKAFLPYKESSQFKVFGGHGKYQNKKYNIFVAKKYSHNIDNNFIYRFFMFYEIEIKPVPFHYALVVEDYFEDQSGRIQNRNFHKGDFKDMDFAAREFNSNWKLRGSDKKMAYQVFGPHMKSLILKISTKDFIGLEISDSSVILSNRFTYHAVNRCPDDFKLAYEIAKQVERNYRDVKW